LITQPDHAHLSRAIMEHCVPLAGAARRTIILHAIDQHDNGWAEEDLAPRVHPQTGAIFDFVGAPADVRHAVWPRGVERLADDPWAAALVAQHALVIYDRFRDDPAWAAFFATMQTLRDEMVRASGWPLDDLPADYRFVRLADLTSLAFCTGWDGEQHFGEWTVRLSGTRVMTPDVFGGVEIPIAITATDIPNQPYRSAIALRDAIRRAPAVTLHGRVIGLDRTA
jgi:hypothetical protein